MFVFSFDSPNKPVDPLLNSYSDYEDSVYGKYTFAVSLSAEFLSDIWFIHLGSRTCLELSRAMDICIIVIWWKGKASYGLFIRRTKKKIHMSLDNNQQILQSWTILALVCINNRKCCCECYFIFWTIVREKFK